MDILLMALVSATIGASIALIADPIDLESEGER